MNQYIFFSFVAVFAIFLIIGFIFNKETIIKRKLKNAPFKKLGDFKDNDLAKIVGKVEVVGEPLIAPLSKRKCAFYTVLVEKRVSSGRNSNWKTIIEENFKTRFLIRDGDQCAFINDDKLKFYIVQDASYSSGFMEDATPTLEHYLQQHGYKSEGFLGFNKSMRYKEGVLEIGEEIAVFGKGKWREAIGMRLPESLGRILEISSTEKVPVYISDDPDTTLKIARKQSNHPRYNRNEQGYRR